MKKIIYVILAVMIVGAMLQSCSTQLCPAYNSYPQSRARR